MARKLMPLKKAGLFNQALMDLGALVCLPKGARCAKCPLEAVCLARIRGQQDKFPKKQPRKPIPHENVVVAVIWKGNRVLIDQRKPEGLLGGLWEFPGGKLLKGETPGRALLREIQEEVGIRVRLNDFLTKVDHAYTHFRVTLHAFECTFLSGRAKALGCVAVKWVLLKELGRYAFPAATHKIIAALKKRTVYKKPCKPYGQVAEKGS
jgi:A/G-specific adenine glycosylase